MPSQYQATFTPVEPGEYIFASETFQASAEIQVQANPMELYNIRQNVNTLREIAQRAGGEYANLPAWKTQAQNIPKTTKIIEQSRVFFLGEKWWMATLLIFLLAAEWFIRWR